MAVAIYSRQSCVAILLIASELLAKKRRLIAAEMHENFVLFAMYVVSDHLLKGAPKLRRFAVRRSTALKYKR